MANYFMKWLFSNNLNVFDALAILLFVDLMSAGYFGWGFVILLTCCLFSAFIKVVGNYD